MEEKETKKAEKEKNEVKKVEQKKSEIKNNETKTKKKETKRDEDSKKTNKGIVIAVAILIFAVIALLIYCIVMVDSPKRAVENMLTEIKLGTNTEPLLTGFMNQESLNEEAQKAFVNNLSWKIIKEERQDDNNATVELEVTNKDFKKIMENFKERIVKIAISGNSLDEQKTLEYLLEEVNNEEIENVTNTQTIKVIKQNGKWQIPENENDIDDIVLPGFNEALQDLN